MLLEFRDVDTYYGDLHVLKQVNYAIREGEIVSLLGGNASGKSTTMKTIMGVVRPTRGQVLFDGQPIGTLPTAERVRRGIAPVLEARRLFPRMTVFENLEMGAYLRKRGPAFQQDLDRVFTLFPRVQERRNQIAGTLSGGEQQMVAIGRALMSNPKVLLCDEISLGLAPVVIADVYAAMPRILESGTSVVVVEQDISQVMRIADRLYCLREGSVVLDASPKDVTKDQIALAYFGMAEGV